MITHSTALHPTTPIEILCVDDEPDNLEVFRASFPQFSIATCRSGKDALAAIAQARPDIIITDQRMPGMSGIELLEEVRRRDPSICRFLLTAYKDRAVYEHNGAGTCGCIEHHYLKPFERRELAADIAEAMILRTLRTTSARFSQVQADCDARGRELLALLSAVRNAAK